MKEVVELHMLLLLSALCLPYIVNNKTTLLHYLLNKFLIVIQTNMDVVEDNPFGPLNMLNNTVLKLLNLTLMFPIKVKPDTANMIQKK